MIGHKWADGQKKLVESLDGLKPVHGSTVEMNLNALVQTCLLHLRLRYPHKIAEEARVLLEEQPHINQ
jgi:hypothetical protein